MRVLAIDYGDRRTGLAFSDLTNTLVGDAFTVEEYDARRLAGRIAAECSSRGVGTIVLGLPSSTPTAGASAATKKPWTPLPPPSC